MVGKVSQASALGKEKQMKRTVLVLLVVSLVLLVAASVAFAGDKDGDPEVGYRVIDTNCGIPAGDFGFFTTPDWWWATYPNGSQILKCVTKLGPDQTPPASDVIVPVSLCGTPAGTTTDAFTKIKTDGSVHLICRH